MDIRSMVQNQIRARGVKDERVLSAMETVRREAFVPVAYRDQAYADHPLPIGHGQTISQPYIVALMTECLRLRPEDRVLEIGTGSGYQTAILAELAKEVYTVETLKAIQRQARQRLASLGYANIVFRCGDGYDGWREYAPYDAIAVTAAPTHLPTSLTKQLADGGRMVIPIGPAGGSQTLKLVERKGDRVLSRRITSVAFVPLVRRG